MMAVSVATVPEVVVVVVSVVVVETEISISVVVLVSVVVVLTVVTSVVVVLVVTSSVVVVVLAVMPRQLQTEESLAAGRRVRARFERSRQDVGRAPRRLTVIVGTTEETEGTEDGMETGMSDGGM
jgi:hypothetical protein